MLLQRNRFISRERIQQALIIQFFYHRRESRRLFQSVKSAWLLDAIHLEKLLNHVFRVLAIFQKAFCARRSFLKLHLCLFISFYDCIYIHSLDFMNESCHVLPCQGFINDLVGVHILMLDELRAVVLVKFYHILHKLFILAIMITPVYKELLIFLLKIKFFCNLIKDVEI